jgi:DNA invertase Pin-like site-specific DNA recombinase
MSLSKSREQGRVGGRPPMDARKINKIYELKSSGMSIMAIAKELQIKRGSIYNHL